METIETLEIKPGHRFRFLEVIEVFKDTINRTMIKCVCECGGKRTLALKYLIDNSISSCGCREVFIAAISRQYKLSAKDHKLDFRLSKSYIIKLIEGPCNYCGIMPQPKIKFRRKNKFVVCFNGIDRVDSDRGYVEDNVVSCCKTCNVAKNNMTSEEFFTWINRIIEYRNSKPTSTYTSPTQTEQYINDDSVNKLNVG